MAKKDEEKLYTLTEISKRAKVSMPTLQRYKKLFADRIPSVGKGRKQRYPAAAIAVLRQIKKENMKKRGRPRKEGGAAVAKKKMTKKVTAKAKKATAGKAAKRVSRKSAGSAAKKGTRGAGKSASGLLTLSEVGRRTGISYPTLLRYVKLHAKRIPHVGTGRKRRYAEEAVGVFQELRRNSKRGPRKGSVRRGKSATAGADRSLARRMRALETSQRQLAKQLDSVLQQLKKPLQVTIKRG